LNATFFGHPRGLAILFFTEMWERFTYYGIRAVLVLFLVAEVANGGFGIDDKTAAAIYGLYTAGTYLTALPGGWIADRLIGARMAVMVGGIFITVGNILLGLAGGPAGFYIGLLIIVLGVGLLKPNVSALVGELYPEGGARLDAGFTVFYMGINVGATLGPIVTGAAQVYFGPRAGFYTAAIFMAAGVLQFYFWQHLLGNAGGLNSPTQTGAALRKPWPALMVAVALLVLIVCACTVGWIPLQALALAQSASALMVSMAVLYFAYLLFGAGLSLDERKRVLVLMVLFLGSVLFWSGYEQAGSSLNLFAERYTDRAIDLIHFVIPTEWFQSLNPAFIIIFAPVLAWVWVALARRNLNPSAPAKFAIGIMLVGAGFLVMAAAAKLVAGGSKVLPTWLILTYLLHTFGEICLSPVGLSYSTKLAPKRLVGQIMGMWFLSLSLGNLVAGLIAGQFDAKNLAAMPGQYMALVYCMVGLGAVLLMISRPVKKLMGNVE
jgi:proton-dependent oligopeptide transporter, POT family